MPFHEQIPYLSECMKQGWICWEQWLLELMELLTMTVCSFLMFTSLATIPMFHRYVSHFFSDSFIFAFFSPKMPQVICGTVLFFLLLYFNLKPNTLLIIAASMYTTILLASGSIQICMSVEKSAWAFWTLGMVEGRRNGSLVNQLCCKFWFPYKG